VDGGCGQLRARALQRIDTSALRPLDQRATLP
jgi:hypothetical protein